MARLADHLINIKQMREKIKSLAGKEEDDILDGFLSQILLKRFTQECAATFFSHIDEIIGLMPIDELSAADEKFKKDTEIPPEIDAVINSILEALRERAG